ncbi:hypothetical protein ABZ490_43670 [Streptomyces sp. NPDC005811]|uniref:hypothetical protein n=1 Tax=Streptomyces sp. NPDC005811 TaxID=3154565 RepID=UPI0033F2AAD8
MAGNSFEANPHVTRRGARVMQEIADQAHTLVNDLIRHHEMLTIWGGRDDDYAQQVRPQLAKTYRQISTSGKQVTGAILSVVDNTAGSAAHVEKARDEAYEGIAAEAAEYGGRH